MKRSWAFAIVCLSVFAIFCLCVAARCHGDFTAPAGEYVVVDGVAMPVAGCPGGVCPAPIQGSRPSQPRYTPPQSQANAAVCRIKCAAIDRRTGRKETAMGSGTLVDVDGGHGLVVTAKHLEGREPITCTFPNGKSLPGKWVQDKNPNDLAAIIIADPGVPPVQVAKQMPGRGELAISAGYGGQGRYAANTGYITRVFGNQFELTGAARGGDSGGPVFDRHGRLIGVLWGTTPENEIRRGVAPVVVATTCTAADGFLQRAGRYLIPYRNDVAGRLDGLQNQVNGLQSGYLSPPAAEAAGLESRVALLEQRQAALEARQDKVRDTAEALAAKYESKLPGITKDVERAVAESKAAVADSQKKLDEALDEDNPKGIFGRIKARLSGIFNVIPFLKYGLIGVAIGLGYLFLRKEGAKAAAGEQTAWQRLAAMTPNEIDDKIAAKVAAGQAALHERMAGLQDTVGSLAGSVATLAKDKITGMGK